MSSVAAVGGLACHLLSRCVCKWVRQILKLHECCITSLAQATHFQAATLLIVLDMGCEDYANSLIVL